MSKSDNFGEKMKEFMQKYDKNSDGKIEMAEVSATVLAKGFVEKSSFPGPPMHMYLSRD
jgi:Ca2+-binding EF-hand superfamily protein